MAAETLNLVLQAACPATALRLARFFGMSPDFWMNLHQRWDLYHTHGSERNVLKTIRQHALADRHT